MSNLIRRGSAPCVDPSTRISEHDRAGIFPTLQVRLSAIVRDWVGRARHGRAMEELAELNDDLLKDMGISRGEALRQAARPFSMRWTPD